MLIRKKRKNEQKALDYLEQEAKKNFRFMEHNLDEDMKSMHKEYLKLIDKAERIIRKRRKISRKMFFEFFECGKSDIPKLKGLEDEWEDAVDKAQTELAKKKKYKYWSLEIEHEEDMIKIVYWSGYYWYRYDGEEFDFELIYDIEKAIDIASGGK